MKCTKCSTENPEKRKFCRECGEKLLLKCLKCNSEKLDPEEVHQIMEGCSKKREWIIGWQKLGKYSIGFKKSAISIKKEVEKW